MVDVHLAVVHPDRWIAAMAARQDSIVTAGRLRRRGLGVRGAPCRPVDDADANLGDQAIDRDGVGTISTAVGLVCST